ncbi:alpha/beta hydrolase [Actinoplanes sp. N902-109]|uniref:alpha/beta hydrolase n=1 Tax=Actinoplanes sp. (strain N902-109) TaxID=649831 RepID=UPI0003293B84|nr:alpha/beta hydrolase [Actinoplanes sp. N902-109]AGL17426.1 xylanase [Actinoplanes sp. N902-109]
MRNVTIHPAAGDQPAPAVLVLPGGGYRYHAEHEGHGYARWLSGIGVHAFVFDYPLPADEPFPAPLSACRDVLRWIRDGDHGVRVDPQRVGVIGSSAGGHLAGLLATGAVLSIEEDAEPPRPDFAILAYAPADLRLLPDAPVSFLLNGRMELRDELSPARHVSKDTCRTFLWATAEDPPGFSNALAFATALFAAGVPVELHIYPQGRHGLGLAEDVPHTAQWSRACEAWLRL